MRTKEAGIDLIENKTPYIKKMNRQTKEVGKQVFNPPSKSLLIINGECAFCVRWACRLKGISGINYAPYQDMAQRFPEISKEEFKRSVQLIEPSGHVFSGAAAAFRMVSAKRGLGWLFWLYDQWPAFAWFTEQIYDVVSRNRRSL